MTSQGRSRRTRARNPAPRACVLGHPPGVAICAVRRTA